MNRRSGASSDNPAGTQSRDRAIAEAMRAVESARARAAADPLRPLFHFRPPAQWMNDPNGPLFHKGWYQVFYQQNPYGDGDGPKYWGHTRSRDLVHWEHLPTAIWPSRELGEEQCWSGTATVRDDGVPAIFYTSIGPQHQPVDSAVQWAALGDQELLSWQKHPANPVLDGSLHGGVKVLHWRDPFIFRARDRTFLALGGKLSEKDRGHAVVVWYEAADSALARWTHRGILFRHPDHELVSIECPNFFPLGDRWVLFYSVYEHVECVIGTFEPEAGVFRPERTARVNYGPGFYASNVFFDGQNRCILLGWVRGFTSGRGWNGCLALPRVLSLAPDGSLAQSPVPELRQLRGLHIGAAGLRVSNGAYALAGARSGCVEAVAELQPEGAAAFGLFLRPADGGQPVATVRASGASVDVAGSAVATPWRRLASPLRLQVFFDRSVLEVFIDGRLCVTKVLEVAGGKDLQVEVWAEGGSVRAQSLEVWTLNSVW